MQASGDSICPSKLMSGFRSSTRGHVEICYLKHKHSLPYNGMT